MIKKVAVIGLWHQGVVTACYLASQSIKTIAFDSNSDRINKLNNGIQIVEEPGIKELIKTDEVSQNLLFTDSMENFESDIDLFILTHDIPVNDKDESDLENFWQDVDNLINKISEDSLIYVTAQVPVGTSERIIEKIRQIRPKSTVRVAYSPENLRLGKSLDRLINPRLPVIGVNADETFVILNKFLTSIYGVVTYQKTNLRTAEMLKHTLNSFIALGIVFGNEIGNLCKNLAIDGLELMKLLKIEPRISNEAMINPGLPFSGGTLARDLVTLTNLSHKFEVNNLLISSCLISNNSRKQLILDQIVNIANEIENNQNSIRIGIIGLSYNSNTSTLRRSISVEIASELMEMGYKIEISDPGISPDDLPENLKNTFLKDHKKIISNCEILLVMTDWQEYKDLDINFYRKNFQAKTIFDAAGIYQAKDFIDSDINLVQLWR